MELWNEFYHKANGIYVIPKKRLWRGGEQLTGSVSPKGVNVESYSFMAFSLT